MHLRPHRDRRCGAIGSPDTSQTEEPIDVLLREAHLVGPHQVAGLLRRHAAALGLTDTVVYLSICSSWS